MTQKVFSKTVYLVEPKIEVKVRFEEVNPTSSPLIHLEWNPTFFSPNVTNLDVIGLESVDSQTVKETKLFSGIPNSGNYSNLIDLTPLLSSVMAIRINPAAIIDNLNRVSTAALSRPFFPEVVHFNDYRSREHDATERCEDWYTTDPGVSAKSMQPCPPKLTQAKRDNRFLKDGDFYDEKSFHPNGTHFYRQTHPNSNSGVRQQCVYDESGNLIQTGTGRGTVDGASGALSHWFKGLHPYCDCCHSSDSCDKYYEKRPSDDGRKYMAPHYASLVGCQHIVSFDGLSYMFNGVGEFWLIKSNGFWMQTRMEPLRSRIASILTAFAMEDDTTRIQVEVKSDGSPEISILLDGEVIPFPAVSDQRFVTKSASIFKSKSGKTIVVFSSGVTFAFEDIVATSGQRSLNLLASSTHNNVGKTSGLFGQFDYNLDNDLRTPNGTIIPVNASRRQIHYDFGLSWMTSSEDSIFTYTEPETNWNTYSRPEFRPWLQLSTYRRSTPPRVATTCEDSFECRFDWSATLNINFARQTREAIQTFNETVEVMKKPINTSSNISFESTTAISSQKNSSTADDCVAGQVELNGVTYVKEGCAIHLNCTTNQTWTNSSEYRRILWTKDELFLFAVNTKYRSDRWSWHNFPAPGIHFSKNDSIVWSITLLNAVPDTTGKYMCAAQPTNKLATEPIFTSHIVIVLRKDEIVPSDDATISKDISAYQTEETGIPGHDNCMDKINKLETRLREADRETLMISVLAQQ